MNESFQSESTDAVIAAELMVSDHVKATFSPDQVIKFVVRTLEGDVGDRPTEEHLQKHAVMKNFSPILITRFELTAIDGEASVFVMVFRKTPAVYVGVLADFQELFTSSGSDELDKFNASPNRAVMELLIPLREGESLHDNPSQAGQNAKALAQALGTVLEPHPSIRPELN